MILLILTALITCIAPLFLMVIGSLHDIAGTLTIESLVAGLSGLTIGNYIELLGSGPVFRWLLNSALISGGTVCLTLSVTVTGGYALSAVRGSRMGSIIFAIILATVLVPRSTLIIPMFVIIRRLGLGGTRLAAMLPLIWFPVGIAIYKTYVDGIPREMFDSAKMDGCSSMQLLRRVVCPLSKPSLMAVAVFKFIEVMTDYIWQSLVLQREQVLTLMVGLLRTVSLRGGWSMMSVNPIGYKLTAGVILFIPLMLIYIPFRRYFIEGITSGGLK